MLPGGVIIAVGNFPRCQDPIADFVPPDPKPNEYVTTGRLHLLEIHVEILSGIGSKRFDIKRLGGVEINSAGSLDLYLYLFIQKEIVFTRITAIQFFARTHQFGNQLRKVPLRPGLTKPSGGADLKKIEEPIPADIGIAEFKVIVEGKFVSSEQRGENIFILVEGVYGDKALQFVTKILVVR